MTDLTVTRVAHSCALVDFAGATVLTDPWFTERLGYHPGEPVALQPAQLPELAGVVISHRHYDHCDLSALAAYPDKTVPFAVQPGLEEAVRRAGFANVVELGLWQSTRLGPVEVTATPAGHGVPESTFMLEMGSRLAFFGADTMLVPELAQVARRFPQVDLALLPINGLRIRPQFNRQVVMDARQAASLSATLGAGTAVPIHYAFTGGPWADRLLLKHDGRTEPFREAMSELSPNTRVEVLATGVPLRV